MTTRKLYQVRIVENFSATTLGQRYTTHARARKIATWLNARGFKAHISAGMVNVTAGMRI